MEMKDGVNLLKGSPSIEKQQWMNLRRYLDGNNIYGYAKAALVRIARNYFLVNPQTEFFPTQPEWAAAMKIGEWYRISGDAPDLGLPPTQIGSRFLVDTDPAYDLALNPATNAKERLRRLLGRTWKSPWQGRAGFSAITEAWNSAVYASRFGSSGSMVNFGGGHNNYFGSSVHAFDLSTRQWRRLTNGFVTSQSDAYGEGAIYPDVVYPDGSPLPPHTYDYVQYDEVGNDFILLKGQTELGPNVKAAPIPHLFNLDTLSWRSGPRHASAILNSGGFTTWDSKRRLLWGHSGDAGGGNAFVAYCPDGFSSDGTVGTWREFHPNKLSCDADHNAMQLDSGADLIIFAVHAENALRSVDPEAPHLPLAPIKSTGERPDLEQYAALEYSPRLQRLIYYAAPNNAMAYAIECNREARWTPLTSARSLNPIVDAASSSRFNVHRSHTFGRFRVASFAAYDLAILVRHVDSPVYAMKLPE